MEKGNCGARMVNDGPSPETRFLPGATPSPWSDFYQGKDNSTEGGMPPTRWVYENCQNVWTHSAVVLMLKLQVRIWTPVAKFSICRITLSRKSPTACRRATVYHTFHIITCRRVKYINYVIILMAQTVSQTAISRSWLACERSNWARLSITKRNMRDDRMLLWSDMNYTTKGRDHKIISWVIYNRGR